MLTNLFVGVAEQTSAIGWSDIAPVLTALQAQLNVASIIAIISGGVAASIGFVYMWFGVRKLYKMLTNSAKGGKGRP